MMPARISILVLTLNEETNIGACLESLSWSDDIAVLDSNSSDATAVIARQAGARVFHRDFDNWASHQNWAMRSIDFKHPWVLYMDADERCTPELKSELMARALPDAPEAAFRIRRKDFYMGRWLRHAQLYPTWLVRVFRPARIRYERLVNPVARVDGVIGSIDAHIIHYPFSHGVSHWIARHNNYSDLEALELLKLRTGESQSTASVFAADPNERRRALKDLFLRLPARPVLKFLYYYVARRGFLDGRPGFSYSILQAIYEYLIESKYRELLRRKHGLPV